MGFQSEVKLIAAITVFCFVCILEWSKHESRCPICRQRFSTVRRPPKPGVFLSSRLVKVPHRDQVYHFRGNRTSLVDPYAETQCSVCDGVEDESSLLLCDLCDTASHTYCVGLGYTVPEGDWFCHDCTVSRATHDSIEIEHQYDMPTAESSVTILDIVREPDSLAVRSPRPSPSVIPLTDRVNNGNKERNPDSGARTLHRCRNVQRSIQALRENWNALRSGSLRFYSISSEFGVTHGRKQVSSYLVPEKSGQPHSLASTSLQQSTNQGSPSCNTSCERASKDVDKAWKMMERAKMMLKINQRTSILPKGLDHPSRDAGAGSRKASRIRFNDQELKVQLSNWATRMGKQYNYSSLNKDLDNPWLPKLEEKNHSRVTCKEMIQHVRDQASHLEGNCEPPVPRKVHSTIQGTSCHENKERNFSKEESRSSCLITSGGSASSHVKFGSVPSSSREVDEKKRLAKSFWDVNTRESEDAKNEIKSLVKLNLKVLSKDKQLGVDAFKEVARQSTYTILASCRSEHPKSDTISSSCVCSHWGNKNQKFHKSTLMPNCCQQCFYMFVKNVVNSTMMQKLGCAGSSHV